MKRLAVGVSAVFLCGFLFTPAIQMTVPFGAGGPTDIIARHTERAIETNSDVKTVIINKAGASGNIGFMSFHKEKSGLLISTEGIITNKKYLPTNYPESLPFDITPVYFYGMSPYILFAHIKHLSIEDIIDTSKERDILIGSGSPGTGSWIGMDLLCNKLKALQKCRSVIYPSASHASADLITGRIDAYVSFYASYDSFTGMNSVSALAVMYKNRFELLPHVPTLKEKGIDISNYIWYGLFQKNLDLITVNKIKASLDNYFTPDRLLKLGFVPIDQSVDEFWKSQLDLLKD